MRSRRGKWQPLLLQPNYWHLAVQLNNALSCYKGALRFLAPQLCVLFSSLQLNLKLPGGKDFTEFTSHMVPGTEHRAEPRYREEDVDTGEERRRWSHTQTWRQLQRYTCVTLNKGAKLPAPC